MKKLRLEVEALDVQSFTTADPRVPRGTVEALEDPEWTLGECHTLNEGHVSCGSTCDANTGPCAQSCNAACGTGPGGSTDCPTAAPRWTCEWTAFNPYGTCCGQTC